MTLSHFLPFKSSFWECAAANPILTSTCVCLHRAGVKSEQACVGMHTMITLVKNIRVNSVISVLKVWEIDVSVGM